MGNHQATSKISKPTIDLAKNSSKAQSNDPRNSHVSEKRDENSKDLVKKKTSKKQKFESDDVSIIQKPKFKFKGIRNLGNTCFMNSILQSLAHTSDFMNAKDDENSVTKVLFDSLLSLSNEINTKKKIRRFIKEISKINPIWNDKNPHDCKEFLVFLLNTLTQKQICVFSWKFKKILTIDCGKHREKLIETKHFFTIYSISREAIINSLIEKSKINHYEGYLCSSCKKEFNCTERVKIVEKPKRLIFYIDPRKSNSIKLKDITSIHHDEYSLELYSMILTIEMSIRHFVAVCKEDSDWIIYDDDRVSPLKNKIIEGIYMLFYEVK